VQEGLTTTKKRGDEQLVRFQRANKG